MGRPKGSKNKKTLEAQGVVAKPGKAAKGKRGRKPGFKLAKSFENNMAKAIEKSDEAVKVIGEILMAEKNNSTGERAEYLEEAYTIFNNINSSLADLIIQIDTVPAEVPLEFAEGHFVEVDTWFAKKMGIAFNEPLEIIKVMDAEEMILTSHGLFPQNKVVLVAPPAKQKSLPLEVKTLEVKTQKKISLPKASAPSVIPNGATLIQEGDDFDELNA